MLSKLSKINDLIARLEGFESNEHLSSDEKKTCQEVPYLFTVIGFGHPPVYI